MIHWASDALLDAKMCRAVIGLIADQYSYCSDVSQAHDSPIPQLLLLLELARETQTLDRSHSFVWIDIDLDVMVVIQRNIPKLGYLHSAR
jgi:hypothetical protein